MVQVLKQRVALRLLPKQKAKPQRDLGETRVRRHFWHPRSYDFNVYSDRKVTEKLRYMHRNPVKRGLVSSPELWGWSSYRAFAYGEVGVVKLNWQLPINDKLNLGTSDSISTHLRKPQRMGHPLCGYRNQKENARTKKRKHGAPGQ